MRDYRRLWYAAAMATLAIVCAAGVTGLHAQEADVAGLDPVQGLVQVRRAEQEGWLTLTGPDVVAPGDMIRTGADGLAVLVFFEGVSVDILPGSLIVVDRLDIASVEANTDTAGPFAISFGVLAGDTFSRVDRVLDAESSYVVEVPSAAIAVRGTEFWVSTYPMGETQVRALAGTVEVTGLAEDGVRLASVALEADQMITTYPGGELGEVLPLDDQPAYPEDVPLALATCGNGTCEDLEAESGSCPADCTEFAGCGDGICDLIEGENVVTCAADCLTVAVLPGYPDLPPLIEPVAQPDDDGPRLHFKWATMTCEFFPPTNRITAPLLIHWGVGCFDSFAHASMHPHPADYQLLIDDTPYNMGALRQSGPHLHPPYCPVGWSFAMGPVELPPGEHTLTLVETITDTWSTLDGGGRNAGEVVQMSCDVVVQ